MRLTFDQQAVFRLPIIQKMMLCNAFESTVNWIRASNEEKIAEVITPERTRLTTGVPPFVLAIPQAKRRAMKLNRNATGAVGKKGKMHMDKAAPKAAPEASPRMSGLTRGFLKTPLN